MPLVSATDPPLSSQTEPLEPCLLWLLHNASFPPPPLALPKLSRHGTMALTLESPLLVFPDPLSPKRRQSGKVSSLTLEDQRGRIVCPKAHREGVPSRSSKCKGPEVGVCLAC